MIHSEFFCFPSDYWSSTTNKTYAVEFVILQEEHKHDLSMYKISIDGLNWFLLVCLAFWALCLMESFKESEVQRMLWQLWSSLENVFCFCFFLFFFALQIAAVIQNIRITSGFHCDQYEVIVLVLAGILLFICVLLPPVKIKHKPLLLKLWGNANNSCETHTSPCKRF